MSITDSQLLSDLLGGFSISPIAHAHKQTMEKLKNSKKKTKPAKEKLDGDAPDQRLLETRSPELTRTDSEVNV